MHDAIIVGGGGIGLSVARELALQGKSVLVLDRGNPQDAASWAAAGMIAPQSEAADSSPFFDLCLSSARLYESWISRVQEESGLNPEFVRSGVLFVASTEEGAKRLRCTMEWQNRAGLNALSMSPEEAVRLEPNLTLPLTAAVWFSDEAQVTPRKLLESLRLACAAKGVEIRNGEEVLEIEHAGNRATAVRTSRERLSAGLIVIASGASSASLVGLVPAIPVAPRKGQILSLSANAPVFGRMIRWEHTYVVPRPNGEFIVGATNEDAGFDRSLTPAGIGGLLQKAQQLASSLSSAAIQDMWTGLRPASPDGLPIIGKSSLDGLIYATAHYRNGLLLAPMTAACVATIAESRPVPEAAAICSPLRFK